MPGTQELTRRIKSVKSTRKVTRAMQMVSASKMRKSQMVAQQGRAYGDMIKEFHEIIIGHPEQPVTMEMPTAPAAPSQQKKLLIVISSNRGLVGSLNLGLFGHIREEEARLAFKFDEYITVGKKAADMAFRLKKNVIADFQKPDNGPWLSLVYPLADLLTKRQADSNLGSAYIVYNACLSTIAQKPVLTRLALPQTDQLIGLTQAKTALFEPNRSDIVTAIETRILENQIQRALLESEASEHSARMLMMKNASDAAQDLILDLTFTFNQLRQSKITTELSEITAGRIALES